MLGLDGEIMIVMPDNQLEAARLQAVHLIRLLGDRIGDGGMPLVNPWLPHVLYSHLPLQEYLGSDIPDRWVVSPADRVRLNWQDDPETKFDQGFWLPLQPDPTPTNRRWPYASSYHITAGAYDALQSELDPAFKGLRIQQAGTHNNYTIVGNPDLSRRPLSDVVYPSGKVHVHDSNQRHFGDRRPYFGLEEARVAMLMFDGSAGVRMTADANPGWRPRTPDVPCSTYFYQPSPWEPETISGDLNDFAKGHYSWTRGGLKGLDYGGLPLDTGQSDPGECDL